MPNLSKTYQCLWNLSKGNLHRIYLYENAFDFLVNNFNQKLFQDQVNGIIYSGTPCILLLPCSRVISKRTYVEFMHVASFLRVRVGGGAASSQKSWNPWGGVGVYMGAYFSFSVDFFIFTLIRLILYIPPPPQKKGGGGQYYDISIFYIDLRKMSAANKRGCQPPPPQPRCCIVRAWKLLHDCNFSMSFLI